MQQIMTPISIAIPTYNRGQALIDAINLLLPQVELADEILIVDQTDYRAGDKTFDILSALSDENKITWIRLNEPSIPHAMNTGLIKAINDFVLFIDDDVIFDQDFIRNHKNGILKHQSGGQVGQILQPWQEVESVNNYIPHNGLLRDLNFPFNADEEAYVTNCMAGNLCVNRQLAIACGGFDEQFSGVAYRFETDFCRRMVEFTGKPFLFYPSASLNHLKLNSGGTRDQISNFLTSASPTHSQGDYYFAMNHGKDRVEKISYITSRLFGSIKSRFYLKKPWWIPARLLGEVRGLLSAKRKLLEGPKLLS